MATVEDLQKRHEERVDALIAELAHEGRDSDLALARALIHRGVHLAVDRRAGEFCALATYLAEMVGHAHGLMHGVDPAAAAHGDVTHN